jgi:hypothetical protein
MTCHWWLELLISFHDWVNLVGKCWETHQLVDPSPPLNKEIQGICILKAPIKLLSSLTIGEPLKTSLLMGYQHLLNMCLDTSPLDRKALEKNPRAGDITTWTSQTYQGAFAGEFTHGKWLPGITWC